VGFLIVLKAFCPAFTSGVCFADFFAMPVFLPLVAFYRIFGQNPPFSNQELVLVFLYWALIGLLVGLLIDLIKKKDTPEVPPSIQNILQNSKPVEPPKP